MNRATIFTVLLILSACSTTAPQRAPQRVELVPTICVDSTLGSHIKRAHPCNLAGELNALRNRAAVTR